MANSKEANTKIKETSESIINDDSDDAKNNPEEQLMHSTNLEVKSYFESLMSIESIDLHKQKSDSSYKKAIPNFQIKYKRNEEKRAKTSKDANVKNEPIVFCFTHKHRSCRNNGKAPLLKRSRKSTNMVKYRNVLSEPPLKQPLNRSMLLGKYKLKISRHSDARPARVILLNQNLNESNNESKTNITKEKVVDKEFHKMTEKLVETVFENYAKFENYKSEDHLRSFINRVIAEIYCFSCEQIDDHPVKALFKCLLEYWIQNSAFPRLKETVKAVKSISKPSNYYFTKDENTSSLCVHNQSQETQCHDYYDPLRKKKSKQSYIFNPFGLTKLPKSESFNKEQQIQELERIIKNTVYYCDNTRTEPRESKKDDIQITKILIENIGKDCLNQATNEINKVANETELMELQKVINYLLSETSLPVDMVKEIFKAYLNILKNESVDEIASSLSIDTAKNIESNSYKCDVLTDCVQKHISKNINTQSFQDNISFNENLSLNNVSEIYLYNVLNKITFKSDNVKIPWDRNTQKEKIKEAMQEYKQLKDSAFKMQPDTSKVDNKNRVLYLSQYNHISTDNVPLVKEIMSIAIKLEDTPNAEAEISKPDYFIKDKGPLKNLDYKTNSDRLYSTRTVDPTDCNKSPFFDYNCTHDNVSIKPFCSSDTLSKECFKKIYEKRWELNNFEYLISDNSNMTRLSSDAFKRQSNLLTLIEKDNIPNTSNKSDVRKENENVPNFSDNKDLNSLKSKLSDIIDEEFKKMLLNKLSTLSKTIPALREDIYKLYHKILEKYDKIDTTISKSLHNLENSEAIDRDSKKDTAVQFEVTDPIDEVVKYNATVNTTSFTTLLKTVKCMDDKAENTQHSDKKFEFGNKKTAELPKNAEVKVTVLKEKKSKAVSNQKLYRLKCTRDFTMNTPFKFRKNDKNKRTNIIVTLKKKSPHKFDSKALKNLRKNLINDTQRSKTSNPNAHELKDKLSKDYKFYQQYFNSKYKMKKYSSILTSNTKLVSNGDLKTLYRCSSDRYHKSGLSKLDFLTFSLLEVTYRM